MNSSGIKRGLATTAVSALAIAGLPLFASSASAQPLSTGLAAGAVQVVEPGVISAKDDGTNKTFRLQALAGSGVSSVTFAYSLNGTDFTTIGTATADNGSFALEWDPSVIAGAGTVTIRATAGAVSDDSNVTSVSNVVETTNITDGDALGVFQSPYGGGEDLVAVSGTSSDNTPAPAVNWWDGATFVTGDDTTTDTTTQSTPLPATGTWNSVVNIDGYVFGGASDQLLLQADDASNDTEAFTLYKQVITAVTATAAKTDIPAGASNTTVTVKVTDQNGKPVAGARVKSSDGTQVDVTDANGEADGFTQGAGADFYYADATNTNGYNPELGDKKSDTVTVTQYNETPTALAATSTKGTAVDFDENTVVQVQVKDQKNANINPSDEQDLRYYWKLTKFSDGSVVYYPGATATPPASQATYSEEQVETAPGRFDLSLPANTPGTYELFGALEADAGGNKAIPVSSLISVKAGNAAISYAEGSPEQAVAGGSEDVVGKVALEDGTGLAGRDVAATFVQGTESGGGTADANIVQANGSTGPTRTVKTASDGTFTFTVKDAAQTPQPTEIGGNIDVAATALGIALGANPAPQGVDFIASVTPGRVLISADDPTTGGTETDTVVTPGLVKTYYVYVGDNVDTNAGTPGVQDTALTGQDIVLTIDHGYFTDGKPAPAPVVGADAGTYTDKTKTTTVTTNGQGYATVQIAIGRDEDFDDDGLVTPKLDAKAGTATASKNLTAWDSSNPLNGGEVRIQPTDGIGQPDTLPSQQVGESVFFDVYVTDQFGNLVGGEDVTITENGPFSSVSGDDSSAAAGFQVETDFIDDVEFQADASRPNDQTITGTWVTDTFRYTTATGTGNPAVVANGETVTDTYAVDWYNVDFATAAFTITQSPEGDVAVGTPVTETVKVVDAEGNPVSGLRVEFVRQGAGSAAGGDPAVVTFTNANGEAFYNFTGTEEGTATVSAFITDGTQTKTLTDTVVFKAQRAAITATLTGKDNGGKADILKVTTDPAADGALATLYKVAKDGTRTPFRFKTLDNEGKVKFRANDKNGNRKTNYVVTVDETDTTAAAESNEKKVR